jgi:hypothetical protein
MGHKDEHHKDKKKHHKEKHHHEDDEKKQSKDKVKKHSTESKTDRDKSKEECQAPDYHKMHMCVLKHMGQMQLFDELSNEPTYRCSRCGCSSNNRKNLCQPYEL